MYSKLNKLNRLVNSLSSSLFLSLEFYLCISVQKLLLVATLPPNDDSAFKI